MQTKSLLNCSLFLVLSLFCMSAYAASHTVIIEGMEFVPQKLSVNAGDSVTWINKDFFPHTATALDKSFNSRNIPADKSWTLTAKEKGKFNYKCLLHPPMKGELRVN